MLSQVHTLAKNGLLRKAAHFLDGARCGIISPMKIAVTGASGLLGRSLMKAFAGSNEHEVHGLAFSRAIPPLEKLDLTSESEVARYFEEEAPEVVVHLAAERRPDIVDKNVGRAQVINVDAVKILARHCAVRGAFLLLISTDYVFDGTRPPYYPDSPVNPLNEYGKMKLEAEHVAEAALQEVALREATLAEGACGKLVGAVGASAHPGAAINEHPAGAVLRIPILYGPIESLLESAVTEVATALKTRAPRMIDHWASRYPIHVDDVSSAILAIIDTCAHNRNADAGFGLFPRFLLSGFPSYTKYEMVRIMAEALGVDASHIQPDPNPPSGAPRPRDCRMDTSRLESLGWRQEKMFKTEIGEILKPFFE